MKRTVPQLLLLVCLALHANASVVLNDTFNYPDGQLVGAPGSPWANHSGSGSQIQVTNGAIRVVGGTGSREDVSALLGNGPYDGTNNPSVTALYAKLTVNFVALPGAAGNYFAHFKDAGSSFRGRLFALTNGTAGPGVFRLGVGSTNSASGSAGFVSFPTDLATNVNYTVVLRLAVDTGNTTLWLNPTSESDTSVSTTADPGAAIALTHFAFRQDQSMGTLFVEDVFVGTSFNDVAGGNTPPTVTGIADQFIAANASTGPLAFTIGDEQTPASSLSVTAESSNPTLVPNGNLVFSGSGASRSITVTPAAGGEGTNVVTLRVSDGVNTTVTSFRVVVGAPTISDIPNQRTGVNSALSGLAFTIGDAETPNSLTVTFSSTNTTLVPNGNISVAGSGAQRSLTITPASDEAGITLVTVSVSDGTHTVSDSFVVTVSPQLGVLLQDAFAYPDGTSIAGGSTDWISHSGTFGQTLVNGGKISLTQTNDEDFNREFFPQTFGPNSGVILYASFTVNFLQLPSSSGNYFAHYKDDALNFRGRVYASAQGAPAGQFRLGIANNAGSINTNGLHPTRLDTNATYTVVTRFNIGTGESTLWVNPTSENSTSVSSTDSANPITVFSFALRQSGGIGALMFDDLKIGTAFSDVATVIPDVRLRIARAGGNVQIAWLVSATGFALQSAPSVTGPWGNVATAPTVVGNENVVTVPAEAEQAYYRLAK